MIQNDWVDVCIQTTIDAGELLAILDDPAVQGAWEDAGMVHLYWPETQWNADRLASVRTVLGRLQHCADPPVLVNRLPSQDWNQQWARSVRPLRIGRLVIRPSWEPVALAPEDLEIELDPKQAFGTGHHATTRMLLEWLQDDIRGGEQVLDLGSGSAILAMAAVKLGAAAAVAVDCDPVAVECAKEYVSRNRLDHAVELLCGTLNDVPARPAADLVLANLDRHTLLSMAGGLAAYGHAGTRLWLSGLLLDQRAEVVDRFSSFGLTCLKQREQDGWVALELIRPESCEGAD
jgi:ribosomal protein L11 methyltransferase